MLFGYMALTNKGELAVELAMGAVKPDMLSRPIPINLLKPTDSAVYFFGPVEAATVRWDQKEEAKIISAVPPSTILLSPDTPDKPGIVAMKIKIVEYDDGGIEVHYGRKMEDEWLPWNPQVAIR